MSNQRQKLNLSEVERGQLNTVITLLPAAILAAITNMSPWALLGAIPGIVFTVLSNYKKVGVK